MLKKLLKFWFPPFFWMALIFWASSFHSLRASPINWQDFIIRKLAHLLEYAILFILLFRAFKGTTKLSTPIFYFRQESSFAYLLSFIFSFLYAISDEFHQTLVAGRSGMVRDVLIDTIGALFGGLLVFKIYKIRHKLPS